MQIRLKDWDRAALTWLFDISTGHADETSGGISHGFLHCASGFVYRPRKGAELSGVPHFTALYSRDSTLWFQADDRRWDLAEMHFSHTVHGDGMCDFTATARDERVVEATYPGPLSDPVYMRNPIAFDMEMFDFFYFIATNGMISSWQEAALAGWEKGMVG